ncbi:MAG TPA: T9SS type A sorting domain-containing protein, partial [Ignavibacteriaceae bacterium]
LVSNDQWGSIEYVTGYGSEVGGFPTISVSDNRVHVGYNTDNETDPWASLGTAKTRDKYYSSWQDPQTVATGSESSSREKLQVAYGYLIDFFYDQWEYGFAIQFKSRTLSGTTWSSATQINAHCDPIQYMGAETTNNGYLHLIYGDWDLLHKYFNGSTWSTETYISEITDGDVNTTLSSVSNDLFAVWKDYNSNYLKYAQWDDAPLAPQGLAVSIYTVGLNTYPKLTWTLNNEPDVYNQTNAYQIERRYSISGGPWSNWSYLATKNGNEYEFIDWNISGLYAEANTAEYRIRAKDVDNHFSDYSSSVSINFSRFNKFNSGSVLSEYGLKQNYPNPFNPTTTINYSLKTAGEVTLKVYDMLGTEVANLVYERLEAGNYSVEFNASDLPSGMYVYRITAGNFVDTKKLILLK